jgi:lipopolysaccharide biosynthesis glycosyltransferase
MDRNPERDTNITLVLAIDERYETGAVVTLVSAIRNLGKRAFLDIFLVDCGMKHQQELIASLSPLNRGQFQI